MSKARRLSVLEAARREWEAAHVSRAEMSSFVRSVLEIVQDEAGPQTAGRVLDRATSAAVQHFTGGKP